MASNRKTTAVNNPSTKRDDYLEQESHQHAHQPKVSNALKINSFVYSYLDAIFLYYQRCPQYRSGDM